MPPGIIYNGPQVFGSKTLLLFTDAATGDTFSLSPQNATPEAIIAEAAIRRSRSQQRQQRAQQFAQ